LLRFVVEQPNSLRALLQERLPAWKPATLKRYLERGAVLVNGAPVRKATHALAAGDEVCIEERRPTALRATPQRGARMPIVHADPFVVVVDKPRGLLSVSEPPDEDKPSALSVLGGVLRRTGQRDDLFAVHRLDRDTSGLLLVARTKQAGAILVKRWREVEKVYAAVVEGILEPPAGTVDLPLLEDERSLDVRPAPKDPRARRAVTHYRTLKTGGGRTLVEVKIETGHKHQIRAHLKSLGHPIVGDPRYGSPGERMALHAWMLSFPHPGRDERLSFESPFPRSFEALLRGAP
jgi:23S rRNA pseudouridine1911/1915/1917 synthase